VSIRFAFPGGAALDPAGKGGLAALAASLLDEGAGPYDTASFKTRLEDLVIDLRFEAGRDEIAGGLRSLKRNLGEASDLLRLALAAPRFEPSAIERVRGEIVASLSQQAQSPRALSSRLWMRDAFDDHPYGGNVYGTLQSVGAISRDDLSGFLAQQLRRAGLVIGAVGDVTREELVALVDHVFGGLPAGNAEGQVAETKPSPSARRGPNGTIPIGMRRASSTTSSAAAAFAAD
jgi:zinc protease